MPTTYFGDSWDAPITDGGVQAPTPVGEPCLQCNEPIEMGDQGVVLPCVLAEARVEHRPEHRECHLRSVLGPIGHLLKRCSCYGGDMHDLPELTARENAKVVWAWFIAYGL